MKSYSSSVGRPAKVFYNVDAELEIQANNYNRKVGIEKLLADEAPTDVLASEGDLVLTLKHPLRSFLRN